MILQAGRSTLKSLKWGWKTSGDRGGHHGNEEDNDGGHGDDGQDGEDDEGCDENNAPCDQPGWSKHGWQGSTGLLLSLCLNKS